MSAPVFTALPADLSDLIPHMSEAERAELDRALAAIAVRPLPDVEYRLDPVGWARDILGIPEAHIRWSLFPEYAGHTWDGTPDPLAAMVEALARGERVVAVESGTGTGKTYTTGWVPLWFSACWQGLVVTTAPKRDQLGAQLWKELGRHWLKFTKAYPQASLQDLLVRMNPTGPDKDAWTVVGWVCGVSADRASAAKAQGFHDEHMLIITEETPAVPPPVMAAFANTCTGTHNLRLGVGNPDHQHDSLHQLATSPGAVHIRISSLDHPNVVLGREVIPGACTRVSVAEQAAKWGVDSEMYQSRVRGISPAQAANALIRLEWVERAFARYESDAARLRTGQKALGIDVAQSVAGDKAARAWWDGPVLDEVETFHCPNATDLGTDSWALAQARGVPAEYIGTDSVGVGSATQNELARLTHFIAQGLNGGALPLERSARAPDGSEYEWVPEAALFANLRAQMYWQLREDLRLDRIALRRSADLARQLCTPTFRTKNGKIIVEPKEDIIERLGSSPNDADATAYGNWVRPRWVPAEPEVPADESTERDTLELVAYLEGRANETRPDAGGAYDQLPSGF